MNLNTKQVIAIVMVILGVLTASTAQLTDIVGPHMTKLVAGLAGMTNTALAGILAVLTSQNNTVKDVLAMPGVERLQVNEQSNQVLASIAVDPTQPKIEATASSDAAVNRIAVS